MNDTKSKTAGTEDQRDARIVREFDASRELVFRMFTDPKKAAKWFGTPDGAVAVFFELEARPGGRLTIHDQVPGESIHKTSGTVLEVVEPERIAFRTATALEEGATPWEALQTVTLEEIGPKRTRVTVVVKVLSAATFPGGIQDLVEGFEGGWGQTFDKLARLLA